MAEPRRVKDYVPWADRRGANRLSSKSCSRIPLYTVYFWLLMPMDATLHSKPATRELPRAIGFVASTAIVVGTVIGSGIFLVPHNVAMQVGTVRSLFLVWIVGGVLSLAGALSLAELGTAMPEAGGVYVYLRAAYGKLFAFLYGWAMLLVINSGAIATLAVAFSIYGASFFPLTVFEQRLLSSFVIALLTTVNVLGVRKGAAVQTIFTVAKLGG
ncbi:MAG TPA: amino acid permease, partial [Terriglobia bacterium]|nr:amino acid permease [Terriglobia bacterium]